jgi:hypothetical protein
MPSTINVGTPSKRRGSAGEKNRFYPVNAGQTFQVGDWVYLTGGGLSICAAAGNNVGNITPLGRAEASAAAILALPSGMQVCPVSAADGDSEYLFAVYHSTAASAVTAMSQVGSTFPLRNQGGQWVVDIEHAGTNDRILVTEIAKDFPAGTQYGYVYGKLIAANRQLG